MQRLQNIIKKKTFPGQVSLQGYSWLLQSQKLSNNIENRRKLLKTFYQFFSPFYRKEKWELQKKHRKRQMPSHNSKRCSSTPPFSILIRNVVKNPANFKARAQGECDVNGAGRGQQTRTLWRREGRMCPGKLGRKTDGFPNPKLSRNSPSLIVTFEHSSLLCRGLKWSNRFLRLLVGVKMKLCWVP